MASNYEKEPIFVLERTWDDKTKLPEKHKFQGPGSLKAEVYIDSGAFGMEFFLVKTLPQFNEAGRKLEFSWPLSFLEFENVLADSYKTSWQEVLAEHFPEPLDGEETTSPRKKPIFIVLLSSSSRRYSTTKSPAICSTSTCSRAAIIAFRRTS